MGLVGVSGVVCAVLVLAGCGGGTAPDGAAKQRIQDAALAISGACMADAPADRDPVEIETSVDRLLDEADKAGGAEFQLGKFSSMREILIHEADVMKKNGCVPDQEQRLRDAAS